MRPKLWTYKFIFVPFYPANTKRWTNDGSILGHSLQRWPNAKPPMFQRLAFAEYEYIIDNFRWTNWEGVAESKWLDNPVTHRRKY